MGGQLTALSLQARSCDDITVEVGEPIVLEKAVEIAADGTFAIDFGRQLVANDASFATSCRPKSIAKVPSAAISTAFSKTMGSPTSTVMSSQLLACKLRAVN